LQAIKADGGTTIVQDPRDLPRAAHRGPWDRLHCAPG
jgi:hypothetical protein